MHKKTRFKGGNLLDVRCAANLAVSLVQVATNENLEMATPGSAHAAVLTTLSSLADVPMMTMKQGAEGAEEGAEGGADTAVRGCVERLKGWIGSVDAGAIIARVRRLTDAPGGGSSSQGTHENVVSQERFPSGRASVGGDLALIHIRRSRRIEG